LEHSLKINKLVVKRDAINVEMGNSKTLPLSLKQLLGYIEDLSSLLDKGSFAERKAFLRSFIKRIVVNHPEVRLDYNFPIINEKGRNSDSEVLPMCKTGSP
jgi:hypothetical protein